jgi:hypothetical protein
MANCNHDGEYVSANIKLCTTPGCPSERLSSVRARATATAPADLSYNLDGPRGPYYFAYGGSEGRDRRFELIRDGGLDLAGFNFISFEHCKLIPPRMWLIEFHFEDERMLAYHAATPWRSQAADIPRLELRIQPGGLADHAVVRVRSLDPNGVGPRGGAQVIIADECTVRAS